MTIKEIIKHSDIDTYERLMKLCKTKIDRPKKIKLGDSIENLMKHDSFRKIGGKVKQTKWG